MNINVQSLEIAKKNLHELLDNAYELISNLFSQLNCDRNNILSFDQSINGRNILLYLATIESHVQQLLSNNKNFNRKIGTNQDYTTISWKLDQTYNSTKENSRRNVLKDLHKMDSVTPQILP